MPYIKPGARPTIDGAVDLLVPRIRDIGELNYAITTLVLGCLAKTGVNYDALNASVGVLECAKQELYRRMAAPYEDRKARENGDVYP